MDSLQGYFLVAAPQLGDPNFTRTVVLMVQHNDQGALGGVLNRPSETTLRELWEQVGGGDCPAEKHVHQGGPVSGPLMAIHTARELAELEILPGLYFAAQKENLDALVRQFEQPYKVFLGHSGWAGGQLEGELEQGAWFTSQATKDTVFWPDDELWERVAKDIGQSVLFSALKIKNVPEDPSVN